MTVSLTTSEAAAVAEIGGRSVALRYTGIESEYAALRQSAIIVDRTHRTRMTFAGDRRAETLTGLVTNDIDALVPGSGLYAAALTPRGKIIADLRVFARESDLLVDIPVRAGPGWLAMIRKFVNPRMRSLTSASSAVALAGSSPPQPEWAPTYSARSPRTHTWPPTSAMRPCWWAAYPTLA
jgi:glycine cleavage system aminomethyltransferase T